MRRVWFTFAAIAVGVAAASAIYGLALASTTGATPQVIMVTGGSGPYWQLAARGARDAARRLHADLTVEMPAQNGSAAEQSAILDRLEPPALGGIAICPLEPAAQSQRLSQLSHRTTLVTFDADAPESQRLCYIGATDAAAGRLCGRVLVDLLRDGGEIAVAAADLNQVEVADRIEGFQSTINYPSADKAGAPRYKVVEYLADGGDADRYAENIRHALAEHPRLKCIVDMSSRSSSKLLAALAAAGRLGEVKIFAFDHSDETFDAIESGQVYAAIARDAYQIGYESVCQVLALNQCTSLELPQAGHGTVGVPCRVVRQDNIGEFRPRQVQATVAKWGG